MVGGAVQGFGHKAYHNLEQVEAISEVYQAWAYKMLDFQVRRLAHKLSVPQSPPRAVLKYIRGNKAPTLESRRGTAVIIPTCRTSTYEKLLYNRNVTLTRLRITRQKRPDALHSVCRSTNRRATPR